MFKNPKIRAAGVIFLLILIVASLAACNSGAAQTSPSPSGQQSSAGQPPEQGQQPPEGQQPAQGPPPQQGQEPPAPREAPDVTALYEKMAEILGIAEDKVSEAFEQAQQSVRK